MAPEVVNVDPDEGARYDDKVDIFSFGFVLFEMVFGQHPYPKLLNNCTWFSPPPSFSFLSKNTTKAAGMAFAIGGKKPFRIPPEGKRTFRSTNLRTSSCHVGRSLIAI